MTDKEQYICLNCYAVGSLNEQLRCSSCDSDAVTTVERLQGIASQLKSEPESRPKSLSRFVPIWYYFESGHFETVVPWTRANNLEEALEYAKGPMCEWYMNPEGFPDGSGYIATRILNHNGFNQWCRKRWPLSDAPSTAESTSSGQATTPKT